MSPRRCWSRGRARRGSLWPRSGSCRRSTRRGGERGRGAWCVVTSVVAASSVAAQGIPPLPDSSGWGVHVLALAKGPDSSIWVRTYCQGIFQLRPRATVSEHPAHSNDTAAYSISSHFVRAFAFV